MQKGITVILIVCNLGIFFLGLTVMLLLMCINELEDFVFLKSEHFLSILLH